jgi:HSP20 family molecular chaperone IbpA
VWHNICDKKKDGLFGAELVNIKKFLKLTWGLFDSLMVVMVFALLAVIIYSSAENGYGFGIVSGEIGINGQNRSEYEKQRFRSKNAPVFSVAPVAYEKSRASQIARSMVSSGVKKLPLRQSLDIREHARKYEVRFALPQGVGEDKLNLDVAGNILTLMMESGQKTYMRRIRIPCDYAMESSLNHYVSNQVLFVEISKL